MPTMRNDPCVGTNDFLHYDDFTKQKNAKNE